MLKQNNQINSSSFSYDTIISTKRELIFRELLIIWMPNNCIRYKGATKRKYQYLIDTHILPELGELKLSQITPLKINSFLVNKLEIGRLDKSGGLSPAYVRNIMLIINSALKFATDEEWCKPFKTSILKPVITKKELTLLNLKQQQHLERQLTNNINYTKLGILISLHTGLRIGEICALKWNNIDLENNIISVRHTIARVIDNESAKSSKLIVDTPKTISSTRDIPISSYLLQIISPMANPDKDKFVISDSFDFMSPRTYEYRYHKILSECGLPNINYHALRHTFATRCIEAGVDVKSLSEILGHSNVNITLNTYVHSSMELKRNQLEKLSSLTI